MSARDKAAEVLTETVRRLDVQELARKAVEDELIEWRDEGRSMPLRNNGCVVKYRDGSASDIIRFGPESAVVIGVGAIAAHVADALAEAGLLREDDWRHVAELERLRAALAEVLATFTEKGHPGRACLRSGWQYVETVARWHAALAGTDPTDTEGDDRD